MLNQKVFWVYHPLILLFIAIVAVHVMICNPGSPGIPVIGTQYLTEINHAGTSGDRLHLLIAGFLLQCQQRHESSAGITWIKFPA